PGLERAAQASGGQLGPRLAGPDRGSGLGAPAPEPPDRRVFARWRACLCEVFSGLGNLQLIGFSRELHPAMAGGAARRRQVSRTSGAPSDDPRDICMKKKGAALWRVPMI